jgi:hypothetical protein
MSRQDEIQKEVTRLLEKVDRKTLMVFPKTTATVLAHDVARYADKTMVEKACAWLREYGGEILREKGAVELVMEFRKAMEAPSAEKPKKVYICVLRHDDGTFKMIVGCFFDHDRAVRYADGNPRITIQKQSVI